MGRKTLAEHITEATGVHKGVYDYSLWTPSVRANDIVEIVCPAHGKFTQRLRDHKAGCGCPQCGAARKAAGKSKGVDHFRHRAQAVHGDRYDYSLWPEDVKLGDVVEIICPAHGKFTQRLKSHIHQQAGCKQCSLVDRTTTREQFLHKAAEVHQTRYGYVISTDVVGTTDTVEIICPVHGRFAQLAGSHLAGHGCNKCKPDNAKSTWGEKYGVNHPHHRHISADTLSQLMDSDWLTEQHHTAQKSLTQIAQELNVDATTVSNYAASHGIQVKSYFCSAGENQIAEFIQSLGVGVERNNRSLIAPLELDIVIRSHNIAIEYCGLYWHSEQNGKGRGYHAHKHRLCADRGIRLLTIYEDEWVYKRDVVQSKLRQLLGRNTNRVYARKCEIRPVSKHERETFFDQYHIQGNGAGSITHGLYYQGALVACMTWRRTGDQVYCLNRYATSIGVVGGFSRLVEHFKRTTDWTKIVSFADLRWSDGGVYADNQWEHDITIPPDYYCSADGRTREHKSLYRRQFLPKRLKVFDPMKTERENCDTNRILRIWDCGKMRFIQYNELTTHQVPAKMLERRTI